MKDMQKKGGLFLFSVVCIALILVMGCTSSGSNPAGTTPTSTTAAVVITTITAAPVQTSNPVALVTTQATIITPITTTAPTTDPILHRYVRVYIDKLNGQDVGYEFKFYPEGSVNYKYGTAKMVSDNIKIDSLSEMSGTWTKLGDKKYLIKILPTGTSGAQIIREYTLVPEYIDPKYPGVTIREHIESSYETESINKGQAKRADEMYYPERAKID